MDIIDSEGIVILSHPSISIIIGMRGGGKTALGMILCEYVHDTTEIPVYILNFPKEKQNLLPEWFHYEDDIRNVPKNAFILMDEAATKYHAVKWHMSYKLFMQKVLGVSRQRDQSIIFITHHTRKFAVNLLAEADNLFCKEPSMFHVKFERPEMRMLLREVEESYGNVSEEHRKAYTYMFSKKYVGMIIARLPTFWSDDLSEAWKDTIVEDPEEENDK
jgi:hypothetical protein